MRRTQNRPTRDTTTTRKIRSDYKNQYTKNEKELKSFLGAIQYLSKNIESLSANTDILRKLLKKQNEWIWTDEHTKHSTN